MKNRTKSPYFVSAMASPETGQEFSIRVQHNNQVRLTKKKKKKKRKRYDWQKLTHFPFSNYEFRCTSERTRGRSRFVAPTAASNSPSCEITSTTVASTRARGNSRPPVQNAASTSTTAVTWAHIWRSTVTGRSTAARNAARVSISGSPTTCTCGSTPAWSRTSANSAGKRFPGRCCWSSILEPTRGNGRISARSARKLSPTDRTWRCTRDYIPD